MSKWLSTAPGAWWVFTGTCYCFQWRSSDSTHTATRTGLTRKGSGKERPWFPLEERVWEPGPRQRLEGSTKAVCESRSGSGWWGGRRVVGLESTLAWNNHFIAVIKVRPVVGAGVPEQFLDAHRTRLQNTSMCGESSHGGRGFIGCYILG